MVNARLHLVAAALGLALGFGMGCSVYTPQIRDCQLKCSDDGKCPANTTCNEGFCRPTGFTGSCDCNVGDSEVCGGTRGECKAGVRICLDTRIWGPCIGEVRPATEVCDGKDNDCDGNVDEDPFGAPECPKKVGVCAGAAQTCVDGGYVDTCGPAAYGPYYETTEATCDGKDNDCDGNVDALPVRQLITSVDKWAAASIPGGFYVFWSRTSQSTVRAQRFDEQLNPVGTEKQIDVGGQPIAGFYKVASNQGVVVFSYYRTDNTAGVLRISENNPNLQLLDWPTAVSLANGWSLGVTATGVTRGFFESDAGVLLATWNATTSAVNASWRPLQLPVTNVSNLTGSYDAEWIAWDGTNDPMDGGTVEDVGGIESAERAQVVSGTSKSYKILIPTTGRVQGFNTYYQYFPLAIPFAISESGVHYCSNLLQASDTCNTFFKVQDYSAIDSEAAVKVGDDMVIAYRNMGQIVVGTALPTVDQIRNANVNAPGAVAEFTLASPPNSGFVTLFYRSQAAPTVVSAMQMCPP